MGNVIPATSKAEALKQLKETYIEEYNIELDESEIKYTGKGGNK